MIIFLLVFLFPFPILVSHYEIIDPFYLNRLMLQLLKLVLGERMIQQMWYALPIIIGLFQMFLILKLLNLKINKN